MPVRMFVPLLAGLALVFTGAAAPPAGPVLFVFAHPDDEIIAAPMIAGLARRGVPVVLALATAGDRGAPPDGSIAAGPALAAVRTAEAQCSAQALGIASLRFLGFGDGTLGEQTRPTGIRLAALARVVRALITEVQPRAVISWGPDGGYGHPDHRLISAVTSEVVLGNADGPPLLYVGLPADAIAAHPPRLMPWTGTDPALLSIRIGFSAADAAASRTAALCHKSQFAGPAAVDAIIAEITPLMGGAVHLRPARPIAGNPLP
jgi:LmbE family N-acetylglucosaminyl deacetylase